MQRRVAKRFAVRCQCFRAGSTDSIENLSLSFFLRSEDLLIRTYYNVSSRVFLSRGGELLYRLGYCLAGGEWVERMHRCFRGKESEGGVGRCGGAKLV